MTVLYVIARCVQVFLGFVSLAMFLRAILSWFIADDENRFLVFLVMVTEPFILPFRLLCSKISALDEMMFDIPFLMAFFAISLLETLLPAVAL